VLLSVDHKNLSYHALAMAKRMATDLCFNICNQACKMHGGYGTYANIKIERFFRDNASSDTGRHE